MSYEVQTIGAIGALTLGLWLLTGDAGASLIIAVGIAILADIATGKRKHG